MDERTPKACVICAVSLGEAANPRLMYCRPCYNAKRADLRRSIRLRARDRITGGEEWHGTMSGYTNNLCRCDACSLASSEYHSARHQVPEVKERVRHLARIASKAPHRRLQERARLYGLSRDALRSMLAVGRCESCGTADPGKRGWQIDHDHACCPSTPACGKCVRGIICSGCNLALGAVGDNTAQLLALVRYLGGGT